MLCLGTLLFKNRIAFNIKTGYALEFLTLETMKLLGGSKQTIDKDKKNENVQRNELTELILKPCNVVDNKYQRNAIFFFTFVLHKAFGQRITASPQSLIFSETFKSFKYIEV